MRGKRGTKGQKGQRFLTSPHARVKRSRDPLPPLPLAAPAAPAGELDSDLPLVTVLRLRRADVPPPAPDARHPGALPALRRPRGGSPARARRLEIGAHAGVEGVAMRDLLALVLLWLAAGLGAGLLGLLAYAIGRAWT